jgi:hypothetical protein
MEDARVMELIDQTTKWWNVHLIHEVFNEDEARILCQIPLSPAPAKDQLIWRGKTNGKFYVRSAYRESSVESHLEFKLATSRSGSGSPMSHFVKVM